MALLLNQYDQLTPLSRQAQAQHAASLSQQQQAQAPSQGVGGGGGMPPMGLMQQFMGSGSGGASTGAAAAAPGGSGAAAGGTGAAAGGSSAAGGSAAAGLMSNPFTAMAAAIVGNTIYQNNKGITSYKEAALGQAGGKTLDYYGGRKDGKTHGFMGKIADKDGAHGQWLKSVTDLSELDFSNAWKNHWKSTKSTLKGKLF
ncbi:hypothetical protein DNAM_220 [Pseudomonas phage BroderSalsa]|nr:hypothetical protein DNAM_220 [Pseudomonas phage BroderSalsa]